jgi:tetratricopeptide (TPR) repeat protein
MGKIVTLILISTTFFISLAAAQQPETFEQAKALSVKLGKPILLKFVHEDCEYCDEAEREAQTVDEIKNALKSVVYLSIDINEGEGVELSEKYKAGINFPVFILTNSSGEEIYRWIGYSSGAGSFVYALESAMADTMTVKGRIARLKSSPTPNDAKYLAKYYSDIDEPLKAVEFYRRAANLDKNVDYTLQIFTNLAQACWKDMIPFEEALPAADSVINSKRVIKNSIVNVARLITRLARKKGKTDRIEKYLQAGLDATEGSQNKRFVEARHEFMADYTLHVRADTAKAIKIKKASLGEGWENDRDTFYRFALWCLERKINLEEAETYARKTVNLVYAGKYRAKALNTVAEICEARGNIMEAIKVINLAIQQDPDNDFYVEQLERFTEKLHGGQ